jgi:hypothetical protein
MVKPKGVVPGAAEVVGLLEGLGFFIWDRAALSVIVAQGRPDGYVKASQRPSGWLLENAGQPKAATRRTVARSLEEVEAFARVELHGGADPSGRPARPASAPGRELVAMLNTWVCHAPIALQVHGDVPELGIQAGDVLTLSADYQPLAVARLLGPDQALAVRRVLAAEIDAQRPPP